MQLLVLILQLSFLSNLDISFGFRISVRSAERCEFEIFNGYALYGHNDKTLPDTSVETCQNACLQDARCLSMDINHNTQSCFLSYSSRDSEPKAYGRHSSNTYFQKVCSQMDSDSEESDSEEEPELAGSGDIMDQDIDGECMNKYGPFGGSRGSYFTDEAFFHRYKRVTGLYVRSGLYVDCVGLVYGLSRAQCHGGRGGELTDVTLRTGEIITGVSGRQGNLIDQITFITNQRSLGPYGSSSGGASFRVNSGGQRLVHLSGRAGKLLDQINLHFMSRDC